MTTRFIATLILAASLAAPSLAFARDVNEYEKQLNIVPRYNAGTIEADVELSQGLVGHQIQLVGATPEQTAVLKAAFYQKVNRNMWAIRAHVTCVVTPMQCGNQSWKPNN